jgi:hypothetical protein
MGRPLWREDGWVCSLQLLLDLTSAVILGSESRRTNDHILLSGFETSPTWRARSRISIPRKEGVSVVHPGTRFHPLHSSINSHEVKVKFKVILWPTVSWPVCLGVRHISGAHAQVFYFHRTVTDFLMWGALSDERRVCVQLMLGLASVVILGSESRRTYDQILLSQIWDFQPEGPGCCIYFPQEDSSPALPPSTGFN